jgi:hypothetical protein
MGLSRAWLDPKVAGLDAVEAAAARLALLTALSPAQMSDDVVTNYRNHNNGDDALILTVAWAAFMAAKRVARLLADKSGYYDEQPMRLAAAHT